MAAVYGTQNDFFTLFLIIWGLDNGNNLINFNFGMVNIYME